MSNERELSQGLADKFFCVRAFKSSENIYWSKQKPEIQKYEARAFFEETFIRDFESQIDSRDWDLRRTLEGYLEACQAKDRHQREVSDKERAPQEDRLRGFREIEAMKEIHEF